MNFKSEEERQQYFKQRRIEQAMAEQSAQMRPAPWPRPRTMLAAAVIGLSLLLLTVATASRADRPMFDGDSRLDRLADIGIIALILVIVGSLSYLAYLWLDYFRTRQRKQKKRDLEADRLEQQIRTDRAIEQHIAKSKPDEINVAKTDQGIEVVSTADGASRKLLEYLEQDREQLKSDLSHVVRSAFAGHEKRALERDRMLYKIMTKQLNRLPEPTAEQPTAERAPELLPAILPAERLIVSSGSKGGKSTILKHIIAGRYDHKHFIIDPHAPSKILGIDVIGADRQFDVIYSRLESLVALMSDRYSDVATGSAHYFGHSPINIVIDELTAILEKRPEAADLIKTLLIESRKVNFKITLSVHSHNVKELGFDSGIRRSATILELIYEQTKGQRRAFILPEASITADGKKAKPTEYRLPGPFTGYPEVSADSLVIELPEAKTLKAQQMGKAGQSATAIARMYFATDRPNSRQIAEMKAFTATE